MMTTADQTEIDNFAALSDQWWDQKGPMAPLHAFTPVRIDYILQAIGRFFPIKTV
jgi:2-polyprenyl-6-hydroxyphenyl methylase/3-demethylubiquinone-9 3-methyltransferase